MSKLRMRKLFAKVLLGTDSDWLRILSVIDRKCGEQGVYAKDHWKWSIWAWKGG